MKKCKLILPDTECEGKVLERHLEGNCYVDSCVLHFKVFQSIRRLIDFGLSAAEIKMISLDELSSPDTILEQLKRLREMENEKTQILSNERVQETTG